MEALKELEKTQSVLSLMRERGLSTNQPESDRFLADFLLFMTKPYNALNMEKKCQLILEHLQEVTINALDELSIYVHKEDYLVDRDLHSTRSLHKCETSADLLNDNVQDLALISVDAMQHANSTFEDFCRSYFMFHELDVNKPHMIFKFLPVLFFTESYIYQLDSLNESELLSSKRRNNLVESCSFSSGASKKVQYQKAETRACNVSPCFSFDSLVVSLQRRGLLTDRIERELMLGKEYWDLERRLCHSILKKEKISADDVLRAIHLKSFDYRVLNLLLYQLRGEKVCELHMEFLSVSELLVEISDDLYDYEDDVVKNSFNILRMFVGLYGPSVAPSMLAKYIAEIEEKYKVLSESLDPELSSKNWQRCQEAAAEGGEISGHPFGTWNIPPIITDEESYRAEALSHERDR